jgi:hypothetical protein
MSTTLSREYIYELDALVDLEAQADLAAFIDAYTDHFFGWSCDAEGAANREVFPSPAHRKAFISFYTEAHRQRIDELAAR